MGYLHCRLSEATADLRTATSCASAEDDPLYAAYVLILILGLRKGEVLGLTWELVDLDAAELFVGEQLQRVGNRLLRRETKTESSEAPLPLPGICVAALRLRKARGVRRITVTMEIYTDVTSEATREALRKLGKSLESDES